MIGPDGSGRFLNLRLKESSEPFTWASSRTPPILARPNAYRVLRRELERYLKRQVHGRSFLISGHRGSGKTTLVYTAVEDVLNESSSYPSRPLVVRLQGPDLLTDPANGTKEAPASDGPEKDENKAAPDAAEGSEAAGAERKGADAGEKAGSAAKADRERSTGGVAERALQQITIAIYSALADRIVSAYRESVGYGEYTDRGDELAAQLRLTLDEAPDPIQLREFWRLAETLQEGVLIDHAQEWGSGQGMQELVALSSAAQAYQMVQGERTETRGDQSTAKDTDTATTTTKITLGDVTAPLFALLTGGTVGAAAYFGSLQGLGASLVGIVTAVLAGMAINRSRVRSRSRTRSSGYTFIRKDNASTLERELPKLVRRLQDAGLAPVFVVDELDKIEDVGDRMDELVTRLKHFVTEGAFFCFLTDRDYFETLRRKALTDAYPKEHTYFTDRLFVSFRPSELHAYLDDLFDADLANEEDQADFRILRYVLLHRSRMHPVDLRRAVTRLLTPDGTIALSPGEVATRLEYVLPTAVQVAVELVLADEEVRTRLRQEPSFTQPVYDALYYVSRRWTEGAVTVDTSLTAFREYLAERMEPNEGRTNGPAASTLAAAAAGSRLPISEMDLEFLHAQMLRVVELIEVGGSLAFGLIEASDDFQPAVEVHRALTSFTGLLFQDDPAGQELRFLFDSFGRPIPDPALVERPPGGFVPVAPPPVEPPSAGPPPAEQADQLPETADPKADAAAEPGTSQSPPDGGDDDRVPPEQLTDVTGGTSSPTDPQTLNEWDDFLTYLDNLILGLTESMDLGRMESELHVLTGPPWAQVRAALDRLLSGENHGDVEAQEADTRAVASYLEMLERRGNLLLRVLIHGARLSRVRPEEDPRERLSESLRRLSRVLRFSSHPSDQDFGRLINSLDHQARTAPNSTWLADEADWRDVALTPESWTGWLSSAVKHVSSDEVWTNHDRDVTQEDAWFEWRADVRRYVVRGRSDLPLRMNHLMCAIAQIAPGNLLNQDLDRMTVRDWSVALEYAKNSGAAPGWLPVIAMARLGLWGLVPYWGRADDEFKEMESWVRGRQESWTRDRSICYMYSLGSGGFADAPPSTRYGTFLDSSLAGPPLEPVWSGAHCIVADFTHSEPGDPSPTQAVQTIAEGWIGATTNEQAQLNALALIPAGQQRPSVIESLAAPESLDIAIKKALELSAASDPEPPGKRPSRKKKAAPKKKKR